MWALRLNPMRAAKIQHLEIAACAPTKEILQKFLEIERVEGYSDPTGYERGWGAPEVWRKVHRKGGPLEWYNPPSKNREGELEVNPGVSAIFDLGTREDWMKQAGENFDALVSTAFQAGVPLQCTDCKTITYLPFEGENGDRVSIRKAHNWTMPPSRCPECSREAGKIK